MRLAFHDLVPVVLDLLAKRIHRLASALGSALLLTVGSSSPAAQSAWVYYDGTGHLAYQTWTNGNRIMDFSDAGYMGGGVALPTVPTVLTLNPSGGDDKTALQNAINTVSAMPLTNGFRGALQLGAGTFLVSGQLNISSSGVVIRGAGSGAGGTTFQMTSGSTMTLFNVSGSGSPSESGTVNMTNSYVPSGTKSFNVSSAAGFNIGDTVNIHRIVTSNWVHYLGMDTLVRNGATQTWLSVGTVITTDRTIKQISGNQITLDVPVADDFDSSLLQGSITQYTFPTRVSQIGIEHLQVVAPALNVDISMPQFTGIAMNAVIDSWMRDVAFQDTENTVTINNTAKRITLDNVHVSHTVVHTGDRMADFGISGTQILVNQSSSDGSGEWPLLTQAEVTGPIAVLNFNSSQQAGIGGHQRWAVGLLCDGCSLPNAPDNPDGGATGISYSDRGNHGSGQGWAVGWGVAWNVTTPYLVVQQPPGAQNWCIGCIGTEVTATEPGSGNAVPNGVYESLGANVTPRSLYLAQLCDRLGPAAVLNIGYPGSSCLTEPPPVSYEAEALDNTIAGAARVVSCSSCSGGEKVGFIGNGAANFVTINNVKAAVSGSYTMTIYCLVNGVRGFSISVNGGAATSVSCTGTSFSVPVTNPPSITVNLNAGFANTIKFSNSTAFAPDLDRIIVH